MPPQLAAALAAVAEFQPAPPLVISSSPGPPRLAPHTAAYTATVSSTLTGGGDGGLASAMPGDAEVTGSGRLVVLHDPAAPAPWGGATRLVAYAQGQVDREMVDDPLLVEVGWSWLLDSLQDAGAVYTAPGGTVTRTSSRGFGSLAQDPHRSEVEVRASWTLGDPDLVDGLPRHVLAWCELLRATCGLPPSGVSRL